MKDEQDKKLDEAFDRFGRGLFKYLDKRFDEMAGRMDRLESQISSVEGAVDSIAGNQETDQQERLVVNHQLDRHEEWIERVAEQIDVAYDPAG